MGWRELRALIAGLPEHANVTAELLREYRLEGRKAPAKSSSGPVQRWSPTDHLLAVLIDRVGVLTSAVIASAGGKAKPPKPFPRPGDNLRPRNRLQQFRDLAVKAGLPSRG